MSDVVAVIPARLGSTRFPRKVIYPYRGKPLLAHVHNEISKSKQINRLIVATDSIEIKNIVDDFGGETIMTSKRHRTGSDRVAEVAKKIDGSLIVNIQADNFGVKASVLDRIIIQMKKKTSMQFATLAYRLQSDNELYNPNIVKVVTTKNGHALWFSRSPIPYLRNVGSSKHTAQYQFLGHIGIYLYRRSSLLQFARWKRSDLEKAESLEQLRILGNSGRIDVFKTKMRTVSVDAREDLNKLDEIYK